MIGDRHPYESGRAIEIQVGHGVDAFFARCAGGHTWRIPPAEIQQLQENIHARGSMRGLTRLMCDMPDIFECPECAAADRLVKIATFEDPDHLFAAGVFE